MSACSRTTSRPQDASNAVADDYERLHRIAQVAATTMAANHEAIMQAASTQGVDTTESSAALLALVTNEAIDGLESAAAAVDEAGEDFDVADVTVQTADVTDLADQVAAGGSGREHDEAHDPVADDPGRVLVVGIHERRRERVRARLRESGRRAQSLEESWSFYDVDTSSWVAGGEEDNYLLPHGNRLGAERRHGLPTTP